MDFLFAVWRERMSIIWLILSLSVGFLTGCGTVETASPQISSPTAIATEVRTSPTATGSPTARLPTASSTLRPSPTSTPTPEPRVVVELDVADCAQTFCPPPWLDEQAKLLLGEAGILEAGALDELRVRLAYDPTQLTEQEVIELFVERTGLEITP